LGKQYFDRACTYCHGKEGSGGKTPSFKGLIVKVVWVVFG
jgi:hypothetical protein